MKMSNRVNSPSKKLYFTHGDIREHVQMKNTVFHYTSPDGINSIIQHSSLWFTDCQYLNDKSEYIYIKKPLMKAMEEMSKEIDENSINSLYFSNPYRTMNFESIKKCSFSKLKIGYDRYFVFCASIISDTQNMWNYFVKNGQYLGYNLGFNIDNLIEYLANLSGVTVIHGEMLYDEDTQVKQIKTFLKKLDAKTAPERLTYEEAEKRGMDEESLSKLESSFIDYYQEELSDYIEKRCLFFKNKAFESEREYRIVVKVPEDFNNSNFALKHRVGINGVITPYRELLIHEDMPINQITLSPMIEMELAYAGLRSLLKTKSLTDIEIKKSDIEIRF